MTWWQSLIDFAVMMVLILELSKATQTLKSIAELLVSMQSDVKEANDTLSRVESELEAIKKKDSWMR